MANELVDAVYAAIALDATKYVIMQIGGAAVLRRVLLKRFDDVGGPELGTAKANLGGFLRALDVRVRQCERDGRLSEDQMRARFTQPSVTGTIESAFEVAMETGDPLKQRSLEDHVITLLQAADDSLDARAARIAIERMRDVTTTQLRLLAFIELLHTDPLFGHYRPNGEAYEPTELKGLETRYRRWLVRHADPLVDPPVTYDDFTHLKALGLLDFRMPSSAIVAKSPSTPAPLNAVAILFPALRGDPTLQGLIRLIDEPADHAIEFRGLPVYSDATLTLAGRLIAASALRTITGNPDPYSLSA